MGASIVAQWGSPGPGPGPAVLYAYDATNIPKMLYSSAQNATRDAAGNAVKVRGPHGCQRQSVRRHFYRSRRLWFGRRQSPTQHFVNKSVKCNGRGTGLPVDSYRHGFHHRCYGEFRIQSRDYSFVRYQHPDRCDDSCSRHRHGRHGERNSHKSSRRRHIERSDLHHQ